MSIVLPCGLWINPELLLTFALGRMSVNRGLDRSTCQEDEDDDGVIIGEKFGPSISRLVDLGK